jgi:uncharacterized protein (TIGR03435 family)
MKPMLRALLIERFLIKLHREKRDLSVYVLVPGKGAAKVKASAVDGEPVISGSPSGVSFKRQPISRLTFLLTRRLDRPVLDLTGLSGNYDFTLDISGLPTSTSTGADGPSIFTAVQQDLGLKLEARRHPIDILVIDSANKAPIEN